MNARSTPTTLVDAGTVGKEAPTAAAPRAWSLRSRLAWLATSIALLAWLAGGVGALVAAYYEGEKLYDEELRSVAKVILSFANHEIEEIRQDGRSDGVHLETAGTLHPRYAYQIWSKDGELLLLSHNAPRRPLAPLGPEGLLDRKIDGRNYCIYSLSSDDGSMLIQVAEDESLRSLFRADIGLWGLGFFLVSIAVLLPLNRWVIKRAMHALDQSAEQLTDRSPQDLRPVRTDNPPQELEPLLNSVNGLFSRIERTLDSERNFTAAAAHELRTPLVAVRMQAEAAARAKTPQAVRASLDELVSCADRASRMVDQLLTLARVDTLGPKTMPFVPVRLDRVIEQVVKDLSYSLKARNVRVDLQLDAVTVPGMEFGVAALVRNLIDNGLQHASSGGQVLVRTFAREADVELTVEDAGPGIPETERAHVFERFYRMPDAKTDGCGVGLAIVHTVADAHRAKVALDTVTRGGLRVTVIFPRA